MFTECAKVSVCMRACACLKILNSQTYVDFTWYIYIHIPYIYVQSAEG